MSMLYIEGCSTWDIFWEAKNTLYDVKINSPPLRCVIVGVVLGVEGGDINYCTISIRILPHWGHLWSINTSSIMIIEHIGTTQRSGEVDGMCAFLGDIIWGIPKVLTAFFTLQTSSNS